MAVGSSAEIGIRVYLDDAASGGLNGIGGSLAQLGRNAQDASFGFGLLSARMAQMAVLAGVAGAFAAFAGALKFSIDAATQLQQSMFGIAIATHVPMDAAMKYANELMNLAAASTYTTAQIADGVAQLGRSGFTLQQIFDVTRKGSLTMVQAGIDLGIAIRTDAVSAFSLLAQTMRAYNLPASEAEHTANILQFAFERQRDAVAGFRAGLSQVTPDAAKFGVSLQEIVVALDVVGPAMRSTTVAGTALRYMVDGLYTPTDHAKAAMIALHLATVDAAGNFHSAFYDSRGHVVDFATAVQILNNHLKGMNEEARNQALKDLFSTRGDQGAAVLLSHIKEFLTYLGQLKTSGDNANGVLSRWQQMMNTAGGSTAALRSSVTDLAAAIGTALLPTITRTASSLNDFVTHIRNATNANLQAAAKFLLLGLAISGVALIVILLLTPFGQMIGIALLVAAAIMGIVAGIGPVVGWFRQLYASSAILRNGIAQLVGLFTDFGHGVMQAIGVAISTAVGLFKTLGINMGDVRVTAIILAGIIGVVLAVALGVVLAVIRGVITGLAMFVAGLAVVLGGVMAFVHGVVSFFQGMVMVIVGLVTGNGQMIQSGFAHMGNGILMVIRGAATAIIGVFVALFGALGGLVVGIVMGIISWFQHLANAVIGHSIIPDMLNAIRNAFSAALSFLIGLVASWVAGIISHIVSFATGVINYIQNAWNMARTYTSVMLTAIIALISAWVVNAIVRVVLFGMQLMTNIQNAWNNARNATTSGISTIMGFISGLPGRIIGALAGLGSMMFNSALSAMQGFANGITSGISGALGAIGGFLSQAAGMLAHHSPPKTGPLADDDQWMPNMMRMFASGIDQHAPLLQQAITRATSGIASVPSTSRNAAPSPASIGGGAGGIGAGTQTINLVMDGQVVTQIVLNRLTGQMQMNGLGRSFR